MTADVTNRLENWFLDKLSNIREGDEQDADLLNDLTVVIPSYCRQAFLLRQIVYWIETPVKVIILDGSPSPLSPQLQLSILAAKRINYLHSPSSSIERVAMVDGIINTAYTVMLGDDEFHLFSGLRKAIQFLRVKEDYIGCIGQSIRFYVNNQASKVLYGRGYPHMGYNADGKLPTERFSYAMESYNSATCYAVMRTQVWQSSWCSIQPTTCKDAWEIQQALATYAAGKFSTVDQIYWLRSDENVSVADKNYSKIPFLKWWLSARYRHERHQVVFALASTIEKYTKIPRELAESASQAGWEMFFQFYRSNYKAPKHLTRVKLKGLLLGILRFLLPKQTYSILKKRYAKNENNAPANMKADLGLREELGKAMNLTLFIYDDDTDSNLREVESLLLDFYAHK